MIATWAPPSPLETWVPSAEEVPHLQALRTCVLAGFRFLHMRNVGSQVIAIHAERRSVGVVETITLRDLTDAVAARTRLVDYPQGHPLWQTEGRVADVIGELLELSPHGSPGVPLLVLQKSALWRPGDLL